MHDCQIKNFYSVSKQFLLQLQKIPFKFKSSLKMLTRGYCGLHGGLAIVIFTLLHLATTTYSTRMHNIHWNSSNPMFHTDNVIEINSGNHPWEYDQVNLVCPVYKPGTSESVQERYIIYLVSKEEFKSCRITLPNPRVIAVCNRPYDFMYFTITFRSFTPTPGGLEFRPGHDYYFISTSSKNDLHRRVGGGCSTHNMRIIFRVAEDLKSNSINQAEADTADGDLRPPQIDAWFPKQPQSDDLAPYHYPLTEVERAEDEAAVFGGSLFRRENRNDPQKEASRMNSASSGSVTSVTGIVLTTTLAVFLHLFD